MPPRRPCWSSRSSRSRSAGRSRGCRRCASKALFAFPRALEVAARRARRLRLLPHRLRRARRHRRAEREPRADRGLRRLLGRRAVRVAALRRRLRGCSARGGRSGARPAGSPSASRASCRSRSTYPERLGRFPAAAVLFGFAICELCWARATEPGPLAIIMLVYLVVMLVGMSLYGVEPWVRNADGVRRAVRADRLALAARPPRRTAGSSLRVPVHRRGAAGAGRRDGRRCWSSRSARPRSTAPRRARCSTTSRKDLQSFFRDLGVLARPGARVRLRRRARGRGRDRRRDLDARHARDEAPPERARRGGRWRAPSRTR